MSRRCALWLRQCIRFARERRVLSWRSAAGSDSHVARHGQIHAPCEVATGSGHKRRGFKRAHRSGVLGHKVAHRKRLAERNNDWPPSAQHSVPESLSSAEAAGSHCRRESVEYGLHVSDRRMKPEWQVRKVASAFLGGLGHCGRARAFPVRRTIVVSHA
jgi:hypothetical protein